MPSSPFWPQRIFLSLHLLKKNLLLPVLTPSPLISQSCILALVLLNVQSAIKKNSRVSRLSTREVLIAPARPISAPSWRSCNNQQSEINNHFVDSTGGNILSYSQSSFSNNSYKKQRAKLIYCLHEHNTKNVVIVFDCLPTQPTNSTHHTHYFFTALDLHDINEIFARVVQCLLETLTAGWHVVRNTQSSGVRNRRSS